MSKRSTDRGFGRVSVRSIRCQAIRKDVPVGRRVPEYLERRLQEISGNGVEMSLGGRHASCPAEGMYFHDVPGGPITAQTLTLAPSFPNIRAQRPDLYNAALDAQLAFQKESSFKPVYLALAGATSGSWLALNSRDEVVVLFDESIVEPFFGKKLVHAALKQSGKALVKELVGADFARALSVLDLLWKVKTALEMEKWKRLVNEQRHSMRAEARRYKLRYFIRLWVAKNLPHADPVKAAYAVETLFNRYEKALNDLWRYQDIEKNLASGMPANARRPQTMGPAPPR